MPLGLTTERLHLRPRTMDDIKSCIAMDRIPEVTRFIPGPWHDPVAHRAFVAARITHNYGTGLGYFSIFEKSAPNLFLGWILLLPDEGHADALEIGWRLAPPSWGRGIATEAANAVAAHAFAATAAKKLTASIDHRNTPSIRVAEKIGMRLKDNPNRPDERLYIRQRPTL